MPVYELGYRTWEGERRGPLFRWLTIPRFAYMDFVTQRSFLSLFALSWLPFIIWIALIYFRANANILASLGAGSLTIPPLGVDEYKRMIDVQLPICFGFTFLLGAGLIADDLKHHALVLLLSKPISAWEYFFGKFSILFPLLMAITWFQALLIRGIQVLITPEMFEWTGAFWSEQTKLALSITSYSLVIAATLSITILAASSLTGNRRYAGIIFAGYVIGGWMMAAPIANISSQENLLAISVLRSGTALGRYLFGLGEGTQLSLTAALAGVIGNAALCCFLVYRCLSRAVRLIR
ncbi:hypothetical protein IIC65_05980 [Candidatus Sumerlaeota bacterium]|nr:hypothetical protein [Candidatus Sumerlaeota bacterium]